MRNQNLIDMNINDIVMVKLTKEGFSIYDAWHFRRYQINAPESFAHEFKLRELMQIFGPCLFTGSKQLFIDDEVSFE